MIEKNLDEGALGVSHSLEYQPAPYAELLEYAKLATKYDRPLFLHLRYSSSEVSDQLRSLCGDTSITCIQPAALSTWSRRSIKFAPQTHRV